MQQLHGYLANVSHIDCTAQVASDGMASDVTDFGAQLGSHHLSRAAEAGAAELLENARRREEERNAAKVKQLIAAQREALENARSFAQAQPEPEPEPEPRLAPDDSAELSAAAASARSGWWVLSMGVVLLLAVFVRCTAPARFLAVQRLSLHFPQPAGRRVSHTSATCK